MPRFICFIADRRGAAAAEFALILPGLLFLIFGVLNLCLVVYASVCLHSAVQQAARYASTYTVANGADPGSAQVTTFAAGRYVGPGISAAYSYSKTGACSSSSGAANGHAVSGSGSFKVSYGLGSVTVPLSAAACFPRA